MAAKANPIFVQIFGQDKISPVLASTQKKLQSFAKSADAIGKKMSTFITLPITAGAIASVKFATDFNKEMANIATLIPRSTERVNELKGFIQKMATETGKSTSDIAGGMYQVISAFGDTADTAKITEINVKAAAAGMAQTVDALNLTSAVTKAYGDTSADAVKKAADLAFMTVKLGQTTFPELAAAIGKVTPLAKEMGVSQEELFGVFATATGVTGDASEVATQYARMLQSLMAPTDTMRSLFQHLGVESGKQLIAQRGVAGAMKIVVDKARSAKVPLQDLVGQVRAQTLALALSGPQWDTLNKKMEEVKKSSGAMEEAFNEVENGVNKSGARIEEFKQTLIVTAQKIGDNLLPYLEKVVAVLKPIVMRLGEVSPKWIIMGTAIAGVVAAIGPLLIAAGMIASGIAALVPVVSALGVAWGVLNAIFIASPIGWIVLGIGALIVAGVLLYKKWDVVKEKLAAVWTAIKEGFSSAFNAVTEKLDYLAEKLKKIPGIGTLIELATGGGAPAPVAGAGRLGAAAEGGAFTQVTKGEASITVGFSNPPAGTKIRTDSKNVDLDVVSGLAGGY